MSITLPETPDSLIRWRGIAPDLWVARRDDRHLGSVQRGRRWVAVDAESEPLGLFRTFGEAQAAVLRPEAHRVEPERGPRWGPLAFVGGMCASAAVLLSIWPLLPL
jgi:hypothetical protein